MKTYESFLGSQSKELSDKFYRNLKSGYKVERKVESTILNFEWIDHILYASPYIEKIVSDPKRFILNEEVVLDVERTKKVTIDTVKHLSKHTNYINDYDDETKDVKPSKLLNVFKEDTFDLYENRFIYTLIDLLSDFIGKMDEMMEAFKSERDDKYHYSGQTEIGAEQVKCEFRISGHEDNRQFNENNENYQRYIQVKNLVSGWKESFLYKQLVKIKATKVTHPIKRTNVILKNPNFQQAIILWDYIYTFKFNSETDIDPYRVAEEIPPEFSQLVENSFLLQYMIMRYVNSTSENQREKYRNNIKSLYMNAFESIVQDLLKDNDDELVEQLKSSIEVAAEKIKYVNKMDASIIENKIKSSIKDYVTKVEKSYFKLGDKHEE